MTSTTINDQELTINVEGIDKLLAFKGSITIPVEHVVGAEMNSEPLMDFKHATFGIGTIFAGKIMTGTFKEDGETSFWDVRDPQKAIVITLADESYQKLIIEVEDPAATVQEINAKVA